MSACEFPDFVCALPFHKPFANVQVLSHLLAWCCVGKSLKVEDKSEETDRLHPRVSMNAELISQVCRNAKACVVNERPSRYNLSQCFSGKA